MWSPDDVILIANSVSSQHVAAVARNLQRLVYTVLVIHQSFLLMTGINRHSFLQMKIQ
jgi:hypothetical protein